MKIDKSLKEFTERYNKEMLESVDAMSKELGYRVNNYKMVATNINESVGDFKTFLEGYADYKIKELKEGTQLTQEKIMEQTKDFIDQTLFKEAAVPYPELPNFIRSYTEGIKTIIDTTNNVKRLMTEAGVDATYVGDVNTMVDQFSEKMDNQFHAVMEKVLWASGYNSRQRLSKAETAKRKDNQKPVFI